MRVFIVDDEYVIAKALALILQWKGLEASPFTDPETALEAAHALQPDLLVSDIAMPKLSGVELAIRVTDRHPECKVLLFSGEAATTDLLAQVTNAGREFIVLTKPVHPSDLLTQIRNGM